VASGLSVWKGKGALNVPEEFESRLMAGRATVRITSEGLNILRAVVLDIPMRASYGDEKSTLRVSRVLPEFFLKHLRNMVKRIFYNYYLRDMTMVSIELPLGLALVLGGAGFGLWSWSNSVATGSMSSAGTVMLAALPVILGVQLLLAALNQDIAAVPQRPFQTRVRG
jgi:hypothetical protein